MLRQIGRPAGNSESKTTTKSVGVIHIWRAGGTESSSCNNNICKAYKTSNHKWIGTSISLQVGNTSRKKERKGRVFINSAFWPRWYTQSAQAWITQFCLQITPCLPFLCERSPDVTTTATEAADIQLQLTTHLSTPKGWKAELAYVWAGKSSQCAWSYEWNVKRLCDSSNSTQRGAIQDTHKPLYLCFEVNGARRNINHPAPEQWQTLIVKEQPQTCRLLCILYNNSYASYIRIHTPYRTLSTTSSMQQPSLNHLLCQQHHHHFHFNIHF